MKYIKSFDLFEARVKKSDRIDIFRDNKYIIISPLTHKASCKYGANTKWCISTPSDSTAYDSNPDAIVVIIIQRNYIISEEKYNIIEKFLSLKDKDDEEGLSDEEKEEYLDIMNSHEAEDLSKIALVYGRNNVEIWDANNINLNDSYQFGYKTLPIDDYVLDIIADFFDNQ